MADTNQTNTAATNVAVNSAANSVKTSVVLKTLEELGELYANNMKTLSNQFVLYVLDRDLTNAGHPSNMSADYSTSKGRLLPEDIMKQAGYDETSIKAVSKTLETYRETLLTGGIKALYENTAATIAKNAGKLSLAAPVVKSINIMADYQQASEKVQPYVDKKLMSAEAARDYAAAITEGKLEQNLSFGLSHEYSNFRLGQWVKNYPEISDRVMQELGLGGVRELQHQLSGKAPEA